MVIAVLVRQSKAGSLPAPHAPKIIPTFEPLMRLWVLQKPCRIKSKNKSRLTATSLTEGIQISSHLQLSLFFSQNGSFLYPLPACVVVILPDLGAAISWFAALLSFSTETIFFVFTFERNPSDSKCACWCLSPPFPDPCPADDSDCRHTHICLCVEDLPFTLSGQR